MSNEGAPKDVSTLPRKREEPPATAATSSQDRNDGASEKGAERSEAVGAKQSIEKNVAEEVNGASEQKGHAKLAPPSEPASAASKAKVSPAVKASLEAPKDVENNSEVSESSAKLDMNPKPSVVCTDNPADAKDEPSKKAALMEAPKDGDESGKAAKSSKEHFRDPKPDIASVANTRDAKGVPSQKATSAPKKVATVQKGGDAVAGTPNAGDTKALSPAEKKATSGEQKGGISPEKATKPNEKPSSVGVTDNVATLEARWKDQTTNDSGKEMSSRTKRSAAKSADSVAWKRKKGKFVSLRVPHACC
jgi:hypothetical protein